MACAPKRQTKRDAKDKMFRCASASVSFSTTATASPTPLTPSLSQSLELPHEGPGSCTHTQKCCKFCRKPFAEFASPSAEGTAAPPPALLRSSTLSTCIQLIHGHSLGARLPWAHPTQGSSFSHAQEGHQAASRPAMLTPHAGGQQDICNCRFIPTGLRALSALSLWKSYTTQVCLKAFPALVPTGFGPAQKQPAKHTSNCREDTYTAQHALMVGLDDLKDLFHPKTLYDSISSWQKQRFFFSKLVKGHGCTCSPTLCEPPETVRVHDPTELLIPKLFTPPSHFPPTHD